MMPASRNPMLPRQRDRYPWNVPGSMARRAVWAFLAVAEARAEAMQANPELTLALIRALRDDMMNLRPEDIFKP